MLDESFISLLSSLQGERIALLGSENIAPVAPVLGSNPPDGYGIVIAAHAKLIGNREQVLVHGRPIVLASADVLSGSAVEDINLMSRRRGSSNRTLGDMGWSENDAPSWAPRVFSMGTRRIFEFSDMSSANIIETLRGAVAIENLPFMDGMVWNGSRAVNTEYGEVLFLGDFFENIAAFSDYIRRVTTIPGVFAMDLTFFTYPRPDLSFDVNRFSSEVSSTIVQMMTSEGSYSRNDILQVMSRNLLDMETGEYFTSPRRQQRRTDRFPTIAVPLGEMDSPQLDYHEFTQWLFSRLASEDINAQPAPMVLERDEPTLREVVQSGTALSDVFRQAQRDLERNLDRQIRETPFWNQTTASTNTIGSAIPSWAIDEEEEDMEQYDDGPY